ncbi:MAG: hypothetical protein Q8861_15420, partial [Bacteroidota bacterium]|nr:hypothetical protein [Bacteroidota bacterium]
GISTEKKENSPKRAKKVEETISNQSYEKTTLGDIQSLADLKDQLSEAEKTEAHQKAAAAEAKAKRAAKKDKDAEAGEAAAE